MACSTGGLYKSFNLAMVERMVFGPVAANLLVLAWISGIGLDYGKE